MSQDVQNFINSQTTKLNQRQNVVDSKTQENQEIIRRIAKAEAEKKRIEAELELNKKTLKDLLELRSWATKLAEQESDLDNQLLVNSSELLKKTEANYTLLGEHSEVINQITQTVVALTEEDTTATPNNSEDPQAQEPAQNIPEAEQPTESEQPEAIEAPLNVESTEPEPEVEPESQPEVTADVEPTPAPANREITLAEESIPIEPAPEAAKPVAENVEVPTYKSYEEFKADAIDELAFKHEFSLAGVEDPEMVNKFIVENRANYLADRYKIKVEFSKIKYDRVLPTDKDHLKNMKLVLLAIPPVDLETNTATEFDIPTNNEPAEIPDFTVDPASTESLFDDEESFQNVVKNQLGSSKSFPLSQVRDYNFVNRFVGKYSQTYKDQSYNLIVVLDDVILPRPLNGSDVKDFDRMRLVLSWDPSDYLKKAEAIHTVVDPVNPESGESEAEEAEILHLKQFIDPDIFQNLTNALLTNPGVFYGVDDFNVPFVDAEIYINEIIRNNPSIKIYDIAKSKYIEFVVALDDGETQLIRGQNNEDGFARTYFADTNYFDLGLVYFPEGSIDETQDESEPTVVVKETPGAEQNPLFEAYQDIEPDKIYPIPKYTTFQQMMDYITSLDGDSLEGYQFYIISTKESENIKLPLIEFFKQQAGSNSFKTSDCSFVVEAVEEVVTETPVPVADSVEILPADSAATEKPAAEASEKEDKKTRRYGTLDELTTDLEIGEFNEVYKIGRNLRGRLYSSVNGPNRTITYGDSESESKKLQKIFDKVQLKDNLRIKTITDRRKYLELNPAKMGVGGLVESTVLSIKHAIERLRMANQKSSSKDRKENIKPAIENPTEVPKTASARSLWGRLREFVKQPDVTKKESIEEQITKLSLKEFENRLSTNNLPDQFTYINEKKDPYFNMKVLAQLRQFSQYQLNQNINHTITLIDTGHTRTLPLGDFIKGISTNLLTMDLIPFGSKNYTADQMIIRKVEDKEIIDTTEYII